MAVAGEQRVHAKFRPGEISEDLDHPAGGEKRLGDEVRLAGDAEAKRRALASKPLALPLATFVAVLLILGADVEMSSASALLSSTSKPNSSIDSSSQYVFIISITCALDLPNPDTKYTVVSSPANNLIVFLKLIIGSKGLPT